MDAQITKTDLREILPLRTLFLQENNFQIRYNAVQERGWSDSYVITYANRIIGYGSVKGKDNHNERDTIFEFFLLQEFRNKASGFFSLLLSQARAQFIECQSNDFLLSSMLFEFTQNIHSDVVLFKDSGPTQLVAADCTFRLKRENDLVFEHHSEPIGNYVIEYHKQVVATGGFLLHYNKPFADLHMEVHPDYRRKGFGSFLIQELRKECYQHDRVPAARCNIENTASKATLLKGGMAIAGYMLTGNIRR